MVVVVVDVLFYCCASLQFTQGVKGYAADLFKYCGPLKLLGEEVTVLPKPKDCLGCYQRITSTKDTQGSKDGVRPDDKSVSHPLVLSVVVVPASVVGLFFLEILFFV